VRELRNVIFRALVHKRTGDEILLSDLPEHVIRGTPSLHEDPGISSVINRDGLATLLDRGRMNLRELRDELERSALELALARSGGSATRAARLLGEVGRGESSDPAGTVRAMMRRHGLDRDRA
jgi:DNA-binding NtrC family response regulator